MEVEAGHNFGAGCGADAEECFEGALGMLLAVSDRGGVDRVHTHTKRCSGKLTPRMKTCGRN